MTRIAQLSFADLLQRRVPLTASEAVALTRAVAAAGDVTPDNEEIFLDSAGQVTLGPVTPSTPRDETARLATLLNQLLRLDEADGTDRRGRVPGGLLVVLARTLRQIDLPPLDREPFLAALSRFAGEADPAALAAIFWRAARMRPRKAPKRVERRTYGPLPQELRRSLRQAERELFTLRQSAGRPRRAIAVAAALVAAVVTGILSLGSPARPNTQPPAPVQRPSAIFVDTAAKAAPEAPKPVVSKTVTRRQPKRSTTAVRSAASQPSAPRTRPKSVDMVNLPRATWAVTR
jgi:hypothetical protein